MQTLTRLMQASIFVILVRPFVALLMGLRTVGHERLPDSGPAIIVANHNSHLDTLTLMALMPLRALWKVRPVAAADHFSGGAAGFIARNLLRTILVHRDGRGAAAALAPVVEALDRREIVIFFPEGSRGEPEVMVPFKRGIAHLAMARPGTPVVPAYLHGMGKCMPKASLLFIPFNCTAVIGPAENLEGVPADEIPRHLQIAVENLCSSLTLPGWYEDAPDTP